MLHHLGRALAIAAAVILYLALASMAQGGDGCCARCGCQQCEKVCRLVREEKKVDIVCWGSVCEDFCVPGHSKRGCRNCEEVCADCDAPGDDKTPCAAPKKFVWYEWVPGCSAHLYTKNKLMKRTITKKIPSFKWVVEDLCSQCEQNCPCAQIEPGDNVPEPPIPGARLKYSVQPASANSAQGAVDNAASPAAVNNQAAAPSKLPFISLFRKQ